MKRNLLSLALVLVMALSLMTVTAFAADSEDLDSSGENQEITFVDPPACLCGRYLHPLQDVGARARVV